MTKVMYAFSGDPITFGHIDIVKRAASAFEKVIVGIGINPRKNYAFSLEERRLMAERSLSNIQNVEVVSYTGLLVNYAYENCINFIIRGIRNSEDLNFETNLHLIGESQNVGVDTFTLFSKPSLAHVSSSAVKEIQKNQGLIHEYVPIFVKQKLEERISNQYIVGITGEIGSGKSHIGKILTELECSIKVHNIELDNIGHQILADLKEPVYVSVRQDLAKKFGEHIVDKSTGCVNRKALGEIVFNDINKLKELNKMTMTPLTVRIRKELFGKEGLIFINSALLAESEMLYLCNNNVVLVNVTRDTQADRLRGRGLSEAQINTRLFCQFTYSQKRDKIHQEINKCGSGMLWEIDNSFNAKKEEVKMLLDNIKKYFDIQ